MKKPKKPKPKSKQKRSTPLPTPKQTLTPTPTRLRWFRAAKWGGSALFAVAGAVGLVDQFWGPIWPTAPDIEVGAFSSSGPLSVPFQVTNASILFPLHHLQLKCGIDFLRNSQGGGLYNLTIEASGENNLGAPDSRPYKCAQIFRFGSKIHFIAGRIYVWGSYETPIFGKYAFKSAPFTWDATADPPRWLKGRPLK